MKFIKFGVAFLATLAMLHIARNNSRGRPELLTHTDGPYTFEMTSVPKITEQQTDRITVSVTGPIEGKRVIFRTSQPRGLTPAQMTDFDAVEMTPSGAKSNEYAVSVTAGDRGGRFHYYFEVVDATGSPVARFAQTDGTPFFLKYIGEVPIWLSCWDISCSSFATVFFVALAAS